MASARKVRNTSKRYAKFFNEDWFNKDTTSVPKSKVRKKKLSDMLGSQWSKDVLECFYGAYRKHGKDWRKIAGAIRDRTSDMVEALYNMNKAYLSLPEGTATAAGLIAMMTDHCNILDGSNSDRESNDSPKASTTPQKRGRAEFQSVFKTSDTDYTDLLQPQPASSSYGCLSLSKKKRSGDESSALDALHTLADLSVNILPPSPVVESGSAMMYIRRDPRQRRAVRGRHSTDTGATGAEDSGAVHRPRRLAAKRLASQDLPRGTLHIDEEAELPGTSTDDETEEEIKEDEPSEHPHGKRNAPRQHESSSSQQAPIQHPIMPRMRKPSAPAHRTPANYMGAGMTPRQHRSRSSHQAPIQHPVMLKMCKPGAPPPPYRTLTNYMYEGMTKVVRDLRRVDPRSTPRDAFDYRFHTRFQEDFYETVIFSKANPVVVSQYIDWESMKKHNDTIFNQIIDACTSRGLKTLLGYRRDWNVELIAQFFATAFFDERAEDRRNWELHWRLNGGDYSITYEMFAKVLGFSGNDLSRPRIHSEHVLPASRTKFMYHASNRGNFGKVDGLYTYFSILNRMFRKTIYFREGGDSRVSNYMRNLLARMREGAPPFSVFDFVWEEIKIISQSPQNYCGLAPYIMIMLENVAGNVTRIILNDVKHKPLQLVPAKNPTVPPPPAPEGEPTAAGTIATSTSAGAMGAPCQSGIPHAWDSPEFRSDGDHDSSSIIKVLKTIFSMCKSTHEKVHKERQARKKDSQRIRENTRHLKELKMHAGLDVFPAGSEEETETEAESEPEQFPDFETLVAQGQTE